MPEDFTAAVPEDKKAPEAPKMDDEEKKKARAAWPALESNPETFTKFIKKLVAPGEVHVGVHDVFGFDPDLLMMVPQPIYAMVFLFPPTSLRKNMKRQRESGDADSESDVNAEVAVDSDKQTDKEYFCLKQTSKLGNACGTIACIHALANLRGEIPFPEESILGQFVKEAKMLKTAGDRGKFMETFELMRKEQQQQASSSSNQTAMTEGKVDYHFVCFIDDADGGGGSILEFDGCKMGSSGPGSPVVHKIEGGEAMSFGERCGKVIQREFMAKMPDELNFVTLAVAPDFG